MNSSLLETGLKANHLIISLITDMPSSARHRWKEFSWHIHFYSRLPAVSVSLSIHVHLQTKS